MTGAHAAALHGAATASLSTAAAPANSSAIIRSGVASPSSSGVRWRALTVRRLAPVSARNKLRSSLVGSRSSGASVGNEFFAVRVFGWSVCFF